MDRSIFEEMLKSPKDFSEVEVLWDSRAEAFNKRQQSEKTDFVDAVMTLLEQKNILQGADVLDVGGGSGRYSVPFASSAKSVSVTDISNNMLALNKENALKAGLENLEYHKMDWSNADIKSLGWEKTFDLVFSSMCPAVHSISGLKNMSLASRGYCLLNQFIKDTDSVSEYLMKKLNIKKHDNPHNDRDGAQAFFNLLWLEGYEPEIHYIRQNQETEISEKEAVSIYSQRFQEASSLLAPLVNHHKIKVTKEITSALILWKV